MEDEQFLIKQALQGDDKAFQQLIIVYHGTVERFARQIGVHSNDLQDITQEVFLKVYRFLHQFSRGKFSTWLFRITVNVANDFFRKQATEIKKRKFITLDESFTSDPISSYDDLKLLHECLKQLDQKYKIPLVLFYFHDQSIKEIAEIITIPEATVKTRLNRGKDKLKQQLEEGSLNE